MSSAIVWLSSRWTLLWIWLSHHLACSDYKHPWLTCLTGVSLTFPHFQGDRGSLIHSHLPNGTAVVNANTVAFEKRCSCRTVRTRRLKHWMHLKPQWQQCSSWLSLSFSICPLVECPCTVNRQFMCVAALQGVSVGVIPMYYCVLFHSGLDEFGLGFVIFNGWKVTILRYPSNIFHSLPTRSSHHTPALLTTPLLSRFIYSINISTVPMVTWTGYHSWHCFLSPLLFPLRDWSYIY